MYSKQRAGAAAAPGAHVHMHALYTQPHYPCLEGKNVYVRRPCAPTAGQVLPRHPEKCLCCNWAR